MAKHFTTVTTTPNVIHKHGSGILRGRALARLNFFNQWPDVLNVYSEQKQELAPSAQKIKKREMEKAQKKDEGGSESGPYFIHGGGGGDGGGDGGGGGGMTTGDQSQDEGHGDEVADNEIGTDASVIDFSGGNNGE